MTNTHTTTVKVYLNEGPRNFSGFNPFRAELRLAVEFIVDAVEPEFVFDSEAHRDLSDEEFDVVYRVARDEHAKWVLPILEAIFTQLNVGGDIYPAEDYAREYRFAGNRSLSVGDLVTIEWDRTTSVKRTDGTDFVLTEREAYSVERAGFHRRSFPSVRRGLENYAKNEGSEDHFVPVPRTDLAVDAEGRFYLVPKAPLVATIEFVQEDLRGGL